MADLNIERYKIDVCYDTREQATIIMNYLNKTMTMFSNHPAKVKKVKSSWSDDDYFYQLTIPAFLQVYKKTIEESKKAGQDYWQGYKDGQKSVV